MTYKLIDLRAASEHEYAALHALVTLIRTERVPEDPPMPLDIYIQRQRNIPAFVDVPCAAMWDGAGSTVRAYALVEFLRTEENQHLAFFDINVHPSERRQGLGRQLMHFVVEMAQRENRQLLITETTDRIPAGEAFMCWLGAERGMEAHINQLKIADLDRNLLHHWQERARERASGFELVCWTGPYPEERLAEIAGLQEVMNLQPRGDLAIEDEHYTPERLRQMEQSLFSDGSKRWAMVAIETCSGTLAGFTEVFWNANRPLVLLQGNTGVWPQFRNQGLGRWLKAALLEKALVERPQIQFVRTGNADSNAAMLKINYELGYKPFFSNIFWQVETARVADLLKEI